jgi:hypothetical protein
MIAIIIAAYLALVVICQAIEIHNRDREIVRLTEECEFWQSTALEVNEEYDKVSKRLERLISDVSKQPLARKDSGR